MGDHTECFQVDFDPSVVTYEHLLELFWQSHDATRAPWKTQYASLVLAHDEAQLAAAQESARAMEQLFGRKVATRIEPLGSFWMAENYHQKYYLRNDRILNTEMRYIYPSDARFVASTVSARVNGLIAGGTCARLDRELPMLGLESPAQTRLRSLCR